MSHEPVSPYLRVEAYPLGAVSKVRGRGWALTDVIAHNMRGAANQGVPAPWTELPTNEVTGDLTPSGDGTFKDIQHLQFEKLEDEVDNSGISGFTIKPRWVPVNSFITRVNESGYVVPDETAIPAKQHECLEWRTSDMSWRSCRPDDHEYTGIVYHNAEPDTKFSAYTPYAIPKGQSFAVRVRTFAPRAKQQTYNPPWFRLTWGSSRWGIEARPMSGIVLTGKSDQDGGREVLREWQEDARPGWWEGEPVWLQVAYMGGRLLSRIFSPAGPSSVVYSHRDRNDHGDRGGFLKPVEDAEDDNGGQLQIVGQGCTAIVDVYECRYDHYNIDTGYLDRSGSYTRDYWAPVSPLYVSGNMGAVQATALGFPSTQAATGDGTPKPLDIEAAEVTDEVVDGQRRRYTCTLTAEHRWVNMPPWMIQEGSKSIGEDVKLTASGGEVVYYDGIARIPVAERFDSAQDYNPWDELYHKRWWRSSSPLVAKVALQYRSRHIAPADDGPLDITPAVKTADLNHSDPGIAPQKSFSANIDHDLLPECECLAGGGPIGTQWGEYVGKHRPLAVYSGWRDEAGNKWAYWPRTGEYLDEVLMFFGYTTTWAPQLSQFGAGQANLSAGCPLVRLSKPAGLVDDRFAPLDLLLVNKYRASGEAEELYGWEACKYIVETVLGPTRIRYHRYPTNWHGLLQYELLVNPPSGNGFIWPPPFGSDALSWIRQINERDYAVFFYDRVYSGGEWQFLPHWGNWWVFLKEGTEHPYTINDNVTTAPWDPARALMGLNTAERGELDINRFVVWGQPPGESLRTDMWPSAGPWYGEAAIQSSAVDGQGIQDSWERTQVLSGPQFGWPGVANSVAQCLMLLVSGTRLRSFSLTTKGQPGMSWGDLPLVKTDAVQSDPILDANNEATLVARLHHHWDMGDNPDFTTRADCMPFPLNELLGIVLDAQLEEPSDYYEE